MGHFRRIFTAPGNPRIWISLALYISALVAILVYRDRIGRAVSNVFQAVTGPLPQKQSAKGAGPDAAATATRKALGLKPGLRELRLLSLARQGNHPALAELRRIAKERPDTVNPDDALRVAATAALDEGPHELRVVAASLVLWTEGVAVKAKSVAQTVASLGSGKAPEGKRVRSLRRLGLLGLAGARSGRAVRAIGRALATRAVPVRAAAARAAGRSGDPTFLKSLFPLVRAGQAPSVRAAALAGIVDLGLSSRELRSEALRSMATLLADKEMPAPIAEELWRTLRKLASHR